MNKVKVLLVGATVLGALVASQAAHADDFSHFSVTNHQPQAGTFQVNVQGKQRVISHVDFAIWSEENGQDDLKWHTVRNTGSNQVSYSFNAATYANKAGNYVIHAYTTYQGNGGRHGHVVGTREITASAPQIRQTAQGLSLTNRIVPTSPAYLTTAVWSDEGGQDDIRWYTTPASGSVYIPFSNHKGYGTYHVHTYQNKNGQMTGIGVQTITRGQMTSAPQTSQPSQSQPSQST